uniref:Sushi domain-containing protein n=1 Tax=Neogobius melanostomus TaxID=47308 RepID=A0A8C6TEQ4_9GOBI
MFVFVTVVNELPQCRLFVFTEATCPKPPLDNFQVEGDKTVYKKDEVLRYSCDRGYKKVDGRPSVCKKVGQSAQWIPTPQCEVITCKLDPNPPADTTYNPLNQMVFRPGQSVRVSCGEKQWYNNNLIFFALIPNGFSHERQNKLYYTCNEGYKPLTKGWWGVASCEEGEWKTSQCVGNVLFKCILLIFSDGDTFPIKCEAGHQNLHPDLQELTCSRGKWTSNNCSPPPKVKNAVIMGSFEKEYPSGIRLTYNCRKHFVMEGDSTIQCINGIWERKSISCKAISCPPLIVSDGVLVNGDLDQSTSGSVLQFSCRYRDDVLIGETRIDCDENGNWDKLPPTCQSDCSPPPEVENAVIMGSVEKEYPSGIRLTYNCRKHFVMEGDSTIQCINGIWEQKSISCKGRYFHMELISQPL